MVKKNQKQRLDLLLVHRQLCDSRHQAQSLIRAGHVKVDQQVIDKPGQEVALDAFLEVKERDLYVSRGGHKLAQALTEFAIPLENRICLDGGISTGGFTDCLLQGGAGKVYGIDVGYGQVHWQLRNDPRVILKERTNLRHLTPGTLYGDTPLDQYPDLGVVDVSFISLTKILPALWELLQPPRELILLVKPQFEVGREQVGKKGVVRDPQHQAQAIHQVGQVAAHLGWGYQGLTWSPLLGPAGNIEYLLWCKQNVPTFPPPETLLNLTKLAQQALKS